ncbi:uncharacterized protein LOC113155081 isoform X2 [Anabas testudineus]|uniref:uncharacterized protein LOC113155081 isoform X2 n=1 Tax=Anabas testudineus TaxID=64144 RepID=UPI000E464DF8|nr:uncharacterized protein LOC113155081 isoform X2 [Anabas testudineus]
MDENVRRRREEFLRSQEPLRSNAILLITKMLDWSNQNPGSKHLVDEMLHSIFFLGRVNNVPYTPESIIPDKDMLEALEDKYPKPFQCYSSQLPKRSPFSCVLDMIILQERQDEVKIRNSLKKLINSLDADFLVSNTACVTSCQKTNKKYYGVSMSTTGPNPGKIVIAASCCSVWDDYVAGAVMTYYPEKVKKPYFDGTINLPDKVSCEAFNIKNLSPLPPCKSCGNLFGLKTSATREWPYGNCAEVESVSNMLKVEEEVKRKAKPTSPTYTPENRAKAKDSLMKVLKKVLNMVHFKWSGEFYIPQNTHSG